MNIKFGTDGYRAIIAQGYTYDVVETITKATIKWIQEDNITSKGVVIGYDTRFGSKDFASFCAQIFASFNIHVYLAKTITPTPAVSWAAHHFNKVGIVITASHNPPSYNGYKIKSPYGGPASPSQIKRVEFFCQQPQDKVDIEPLETLISKGIVDMIDLRAIYIEELKKCVDMDAICNSGICIAHDAMYGVSQGIFESLMGKSKVHALRNELNPSFHGQAPEPIESNLSQLKRLVADHPEIKLGIANDGDADRLGVFDSSGNFVMSHYIMSLLLKYLWEEKGVRGSIARTFSTTEMLQKQADKYKAKIHTTPIGFKYIADIMQSESVVVGGEESGGIAVAGHICERDGIYVALMILELLVSKNVGLGDLMDELYHEYGPHHFSRTDLHIDSRKKNRCIEMCVNKEISQICDEPVLSWNMLDGVKHILKDSWVLVRASGTEPVLRIYSEAPTMEQCVALNKGIGDIFLNDA